MTVYKPGMKIGYDAKRFFLNNTGLGNYSRWLVKSVSLFYPDNKYLLYTPKLRPNNRVNFLSDNILTVTPNSKTFTAWWRTKSIVDDLQRDGIELYHGLSHELPYRINRSGIRSVVTVHDLIFKRFPQYFGRVSRAIYAAKLKYACRVADKIIAVSERTKNDLIELLNIAPSKIEVIYQGCDESFKTACPPAQKQAVLKKYRITGPFILSVGTIEERKNLLVLIKALSKVKEPVKLVVIGRQTGYADLIKDAIHRYQLTDRMIFLDKVSFADLPAFYQSASVFVYPSRYEGFGIPILEALNSGTPVIAATGSCLEEAGGPDSLYITPDDELALAQKISSVLTDEALRQKMIAKGKIYARNFDDDKLAAQLMAVYTPLLNLPR
jgi:glycosyltransferase involved in cell wall biosynthesis